MKKEQFQPTETFLSALSGYFDYAGMNNPFEKVYIPPSNNDENQSITMFIYVIAHLPKLFIPQNAGEVINRDNNFENHLFLLHFKVMSTGDIWIKSMAQHFRQVCIRY